MEELLQRMARREATVGVIGLGYVGLPVVQALAGAGFSVLGFDVDAAKIACLQRGESYISHIPAERLLAYQRDGRVDFSSDYSRTAAADALIICVPTPLNDARDPDLSAVESTAGSVAEHLRSGQLIVLQSTTYPGTTDEIVRPILESSGLVCGKDFFLAYSPEREDPGRRDFDLRTTPKIVGGVDAASGQVAVALFEHLVETVVPVSSARVAEAAKILENMYRAVNIAMVNELKMLFDRMDVDIWEVIEAAKTKPFGYQPFYPGPGLGGHCIPIDPFYLSWKAREYGFTTRFIELAGEINRDMPHYVLRKIQAGLNARRKPLNGSRVLVLGVAYKKNVGDFRESPAILLVQELLSYGAQVSYHDPHVALFDSRRYGISLRSQELSAAMLAEQDCVCLLTDHKAFDLEAIVEAASFVVDTRNACASLPARLREKVVQA